MENILLIEALFILVSLFLLALLEKSVIISYRQSIDAVLANLPVSPSVRQSTSVDRYGFSNWIARKLHRPFVPRSFCSWIHGWIWWNPRDFKDFGFQPELTNIVNVVSTRTLALAAKSLGVNNVVAAGLPYSYILRYSECLDGVARIPNSAMFVLDHSSEGVSVDHNIIEYLDYIYSIGQCFSCVSILVYDLDFVKLAPIIESYGFIPLIGASPRCPNSMQRVKAFFDIHEFVSTNFIGSHVLYALASGCRVSISGPYADRQPSIHSSEVSKGMYDNAHVEHLCYVASLEFLKKSRLSFLLFDNPLLAPASAHSLSTFVAEELGFAEMLPLEELPQLLGWDLKGQFNGYARGGMRRAKRLIVKF